MPKVLPSLSTEEVKKGSVLTLYSSKLLIDDSGSDITKTPASQSAELFCPLVATECIYIHKILHLGIEIPTPRNTTPSQQCLAAYSIRNSHHEAVFVVKELLPQEKRHFTYSITSDGDLVLTADGQETRSGVDVLLKSLNEVVRGRVTSTSSGICWNKVSMSMQDYATGIQYRLSCPRWLSCCAVGLFCVSPTFEIRKVTTINPTLVSALSAQTFSGPPQVVGDEIVALFGKKDDDSTPWKETTYALCFIKQGESSDNRMFLMGTALVIFHLYFKNKNAAVRSLLIWTAIMGAIILVLVAVIILIYYYLLS